MRERCRLLRWNVATERSDAFLSANFELAALLARLNDASTHELFFAFENVFAKMCAQIWDVGLLNVVPTRAMSQY